MLEYIYAKKNIDFHSYVINIHSFGPKPTYDCNLLVPLPGPKSMFFMLWDLILLLKVW